MRIRWLMPKSKASNLELFFRNFRKIDGQYKIKNGYLSIQANAAQDAIIVLSSDNRFQASGALDELLPILYPPIYGVTVWQSVLDIRLLVGDMAIGRLLGRNGGNLVLMRIKSGVSIRIFSEYAPESDERVLKISGAPDKVKVAIGLVLESLEVTSLYHPVKVYYPHPKHDIAQPTYGGFNTNAAIAEQHRLYSARSDEVSQPQRYSSRPSIIPPRNSSALTSTLPRPSTITSYASPPQDLPVQLPQETSEIYEVVDEILDDAMSIISDDPLPPSPPLQRAQFRYEPCLSDPNTIPLPMLPPHALVNRRLLSPPILTPSQVQISKSPSPSQTPQPCSPPSNSPPNKPAFIKCTIVGDSNVAEHNGFDIRQLIKSQWPAHWKLQPVQFKSGGTFVNLTGKASWALAIARKGDKVIIVIGANDVRDMTRTKGPYDPWYNLKKVVERARMSSASVYIVTPVPSPCYGPDEKKLPSHLRNPAWCPVIPCAHEWILADTLAEYITKLTDLTKNIMNIKLLDISSPFLDSQKVAERDFFISNDIHLKTESAQMLGRYIVQCVSELQ